LELVHARADAAHDLLVGVGADAVRVAEHLDFGRRLVHATLGHGPVQRLAVHGKVGHARKVDGHRRHLAVRVHAVEHEQRRAVQRRGQLVRELDRIHAIELLEVARRLDPYKHGELINIWANL
jgi:hypothetical protein